MFGCHWISGEGQTVFGGWRWAAVCGRRPGVARVVGGGVSVEARGALLCVVCLMGPGAPRRTVAAGVCVRGWVYLPSRSPVEAFVGGGG